MKNKDKRTLREDGRILIRGCKLLFEIWPKHTAYLLICQMISCVSPYFSLYMSALLVNELSNTCDGKRLFLLALITVFGLLAINVLNRILNGRMNVWEAQYFQDHELYFFNQQNKFQYEHLENPEVTLLREEIFASANATGAGLFQIQWSFSILISSMFDLIVSVSLTFSMFRMITDGNFNGFLAFINSPYSAVMILLIILVNVILSIRINGRRTEKVQKAWANLAKSNTILSAYENMWGTDVAIFDLKNIILNEFAKINLRPQYIQESEKIHIKYNAMSIVLKTLLNMSIFIFTAAKTFIGVFEIGNFILYRGTISRFIEAISSIAESIAWLRSNNKYLLQIYKYLDLPDNMYHGTLAVEKRDDIDYEIEFKNVSFRYPHTDTWILKNVSMKFKIGDKLAIVGENGSGKTTFIKLLCRLYDPTEGTILLNGIDITRYRYEEYISLFSVVFQDYKLFQFSLAANVTASFDYNEEKVKENLKSAGFGDRLNKLEHGIETVIGRDYENDGIDLSGGEAQKIALARALYKDAPFVILDEPTAALDPIAEAAVYESFNRIVQNKTAVFISHRLSSCRFCDDIAVFDKGQLVQKGNHDMLVNENGKYRELWYAQAQYYRE